ncbi:MAG: hypothetical protein COB02_02110 [Candidatus Cloacimonadota bacterium]|nr:MAG: hypothetical protein COB02_02110 [Candidatus Cloacimonadota bacterium]
MSEKNLHPNIEPHVSIIGDKYLIIEEIRAVCKGGLYTAEPINGGNPVVLKILFNYKIKDDSHFASMEDQFFQYIEIDNPHLPQAIELLRSDITGTSGVYPILVFKKKNFISSKEAMQKEEHGQFEPNRAMAIIKDICSALLALSEKGIVHGNLSSNCISVSKNYSVTVWDFLLFGKSEREELSEINLNKQKYMAPELFDGGETSISTDIYAVGCLLHEYLEGQPPFIGKNQEEQHLSKTCLGLNVIASKINKLLLKSINKAPGKRQQNFQVFIKSLQKLIKVKALGGKKSKSSGGKLIPILIILFFIAGLGGGGYFYFSTSKKTVKRKRIMVKVPNSKSKKKRRPKKSSRKKAKKPIEKISDIIKKLDKIEGMIAFSKPKFTMGSDYGEDDSQPAHEVKLSPFYIDQFEITNEQYKKFVVFKKGSAPKNPIKRFNLWTKSSFNKKIRSQPVINIKWQQAHDYCLFVAKRLPTEAEWEFAARGQEGRQYPWGNIEPDPNVAQFDGEWAKGNTLYEVDFFEEGKTPEGVYNLLGGVREWVADWYDPEYYAKSEKKDPKGPSEGTKKVQRGGSWEDTPEFSIFRETSSPKSAQEGTGFRCAKGAK